MSSSLLVAVTVVVALVAAVRSTWSPCGLSMLSTITPLGEASRGHSYGVTVAWFVLGAVLGGVTLGLGAAVLAAGLGALAPSATTLLTVGALLALTALASDLRVGGFALPGHRRQVDEVWLTGFRPWVYGLGFGWQIGVGLATYIVTSAVYLGIALAVLTGLPGVALAVGVTFGSVRGLAVLLGVGLVSPEALRAFHLRFERLGPVSARLTSAVLALAAVTLAVGAHPLLGAATAVVVLAAAVLGTRPTARRARSRIAVPA